MSDNQFLARFERRYRDDDNYWWQFDSGVHQRLFDEVLWQRDEARKRISELREALKRLEAAMSELVVINEARNTELAAARAESSALRDALIKSHGILARADRALAQVDNILIGSPHRMFSSDDPIFEDIIKGVDITDEAEAHGFLTVRSSESELRDHDADWTGDVTLGSEE